MVLIGASFDLDCQTFPLLNHLAAGEVDSIHEIVRVLVVARVEHQTVRGNHFVLLDQYQSAREGATVIGQFLRQILLHNMKHRAFVLLFVYLLGPRVIRVV